MSFSQSLARLPFASSLAMLSSGAGEPHSASSAALVFDTPFSKTSQELIQFMTTLRGLGAQVYLDLPRIIVIGNQSAGKSSLVEAISGISVPRDAGTCTRCPMECRLTHSPDEWSCQISIRWEFDAAGRHLARGVQEVPFGPRITDKDQVEPMLRRAQAAILSTASGGPVAHFVDMDLAEVRSRMDPKSGERPLAFSRNTICVDLRGPDLADLSFVDLPGIVQNAEAEIVNLVEELVTSYADGNCLILVALPMSDDIENQKAARIARHADPLGLRTIGVLTKPDTIPAGSTKRRQMWLDVIEGREHPLQHGYYCTRQPDDDQRLEGITPAAARAAEARFFKTTAPWSTSTCSHRFGTANLVKTISKLLTKIISDWLPTLLSEVADQLAATNQALDALPPQIATEPSAFVLDLVTKFRNDVVELVQGSPQHPLLVQKNNETYERFMHAIRGTAPAFVPYEDAQHAPTRGKQQYTRLDEDEDEGKAVVRLGTKFMYLEDVRQHIQASVTRELPNNIPYPAKRALIHDFQKTWRTHSIACFGSVQGEFKKSLTDLTRQRFERFPRLKGVVAPIVMEQGELCSRPALAHLETILEVEIDAPPYTQNKHYYTEKREKHLAQYKQARWHPPTAKGSGSVPHGGGDGDTYASVQDLSASGGPSNGLRDEWSFAARRRPKVLSEENETLKDVLAGLMKLGYPATEEDLAKLKPADEYEEELVVMAEVRAYFQVAYKRIIDYVPRIIDLKLLYTLADRMQGVLIEKLGLGSAKADERCAAYIAEDPHVVASRTELLAKKKKLEEVQRALFDFGR
ncbi:hypothetical protein OH77DRAFT_1068510 [Trametes cingulata]|nr:hypothetical protein OH77DRAFT_1068510 [Trametes cingulata]